MGKFNEGKACDAVLRRIEAREGATRSELCFPEREGHDAPVELACCIGARRFALEHTGIEPFDGLQRMEAEAGIRLQPIIDGANEALPAGEFFDIQIPVDSLSGLPRRDLIRVQKALVTWIRTTAPTLPMARRTEYVFTRAEEDVPGVPFAIALARASHGFGRPGLRIAHMVDGSTSESRRLERIRRAFDKKCPKLSKWRGGGARTVLVLEENDLQMTNVHLVAAAVVKVETEIRDPPDEVWLVSSALETEWYIYAIRIDHQAHADFGFHGRSVSTVDPSSLIDLTRRG